MATSTDLYRDRRLAEGYPNLDRLASDYFTRTQGEREDYLPALERIMTYLDRLVDLRAGRNIVVVGCGPKPRTLQVLNDMGHHAVGVEPITSFVQTAREYVGDASAVLQGTAERMPLDDESQHVVFLESVLEHVDSPLQSLAELYRVLLPGGIAFVVTTNRFKFKVSGDNGEYTTRFYNWFPRLVKECYVFQHLHYKPSLAHYAGRPAVHWFCYSDLCRLGRSVGFAQFYSILDLARAEDPMISKSWLRGKIIGKVRQHPWLRALVLTQLGGTVVMLKRSTG